MLRNPALENQFKYTPVRVFDLEEDERKPESGIFNDICTVAVNGEWDNQVCFFFSVRVTDYNFDAYNISEE